MLDAAALVEKYRGKGALVDTNLLVLLLVGAVNRRRILEFKRLDSFGVEDFELLSRLIGRLGKLYVTPHVLSQVSDLTKLPGRELELIRQKFRILVQRIEEFRDPSRELVADPMFDRFGLADAAIAKVNARGILVVTVDVRLYLALQHRGWDALNFNHLRQLGWY